MTYANGRYQPLCRNRVVSVMTCDELAAWADGYNTACTLLGLDCGMREASADKFANAVGDNPAPAASDVDWLRSFVDERVTKLRTRCQGDVATDARRRAKS